MPEKRDFPADAPGPRCYKSSPMNELVTITYRDKAVHFEPWGGGAVEERLRTNRFYEEDMLRYIESLELGGAYVDVGAYVGTHTLFMARYCAADRVHGFEPRPAYFERLRRNVKANDIGDRAVVHSLGLSDRDETVSITFENKTETITCRRLDDIISGPVSVMKIDVEGMEEKVLSGARRILAESKPLLFIEAHTADELKKNLQVLAPYGYRATGRVFNTSPTFEFACADSPTAPLRRLPRVRSLLEPRLWFAEGPGVKFKVKPGRLEARVRLPAEQTVHLSQQMVRLRQCPAGDPFPVAPGSTWFLEVDGRATGDDDFHLAIFVMEYDDEQRIGIQRFVLRRRLFEPLNLRPETRRIRIALRLASQGSVQLDRLAFHVRDCF